MDKILRQGLIFLVVGAVILMGIQIITKLKAEKYQPISIHLSEEQKQTISLYEEIMRRESPLNFDWSMIGDYKYTPSHRQMVWRYALEFCESRGENTALLPKDRDGTASYSNFQFKPSTLKYYAEKYKLLPFIPKRSYLMLTYEYKLTSEVVNRMINDKDVKWPQEFPVCLSRLGYPPK